MRLPAILLAGVAFLSPLKAQALDLGKVLKIRVTEYCLRGTMANGRRVHLGAAAIDNSLFRFGTRFTIPAMRRTNLQRTSFRGEDTGGAIIGYHIDVWNPVCYEALQWGSRVVPVYVQ